MITLTYKGKYTQSKLGTHVRIFNVSTVYVSMYACACMHACMLGLDNICTEYRDIKVS